MSLNVHMPRSEVMKGRVSDKTVGVGIKVEGTGAAMGERVVDAGKLAPPGWYK